MLPVPNSFFVTTSKALVTSSDAPAPNSFFVTTSRKAGAPSSVLGHCY